MSRGALAMSIESIAFWLLAAAMVIAALAFVLPRLIGRDAPSHGSSRDVLNARVIRAEIEEIDREQAAARPALVQIRDGRPGVLARGERPVPYPQWSERQVLK